MVVTTFARGRGARWHATTSESASRTASSARCGRSGRTQGRRTRGTLEPFSVGRQQEGRPQSVRAPAVQQLGSPGGAPGNPRVGACGEGAAPDAQGLHVDGAWRQRLRHRPSDAPRGTRDAPPPRSEAEMSASPGNHRRTRVAALVGGALLLASLAATAPRRQPRPPRRRLPTSRRREYSAAGVRGDHTPHIPALVARGGPWW